MKFPSIVADIMNEVITIEGSSLVEEAAKKMLENKIGSIVITDTGKPVGIVTKSDMLSRVIVAYRDPRIHQTQTIMSSPLISIEKDTPIMEAMRFLKNRDIHRVLVEDKGELVGIISEGDLIRAVTLSSLTQFSSLLRRK